jgi:translation elongation factor EF-G
VPPKIVLPLLRRKTTLTERLLYAASVIDQIGSVDAGTTQTDSLALERQRGITIKSAVVSFAVGDVTVNLIDTPGHPDFIAEVERVLSVQAAQPGRNSDRRPGRRTAARRGPAARAQDLQRQLPGLTSGEGAAEASFGGYRPVTGPPPARRRILADPLNREEYMMQLAGRATAASAEQAESSGAR